MLAMLPFLLSTLAAPPLPGIPVLVLPAAGAVAMFFLWRYVPLVKR
jgi:hypothetical protein